MTHRGTYGSPFAIGGAICKFYQVKRILNIFIKLIDRTVRILRVILELAGKSAAEYRKRFCTYILREEEILIKTEAV